MKKITALLLFVLMAVMPFSASMAAGHPARVVIWGVTLDAANPYYKNGPSGKAGSLVTGNDAWNAYYDEANGELTFRNLNVAAGSAEYLGDMCGIYAVCNTADSLTIILKGSNSVSTADSNSLNPCAVKINCNLTMKGSGTLALRAGKASPPVLSRSSYGLTAYSITQTDGVIEANGGEATAGSSYGVYASHQITASGGSLTGVGGKSGAGSYYESIGVFANSGISISGGSLTGSGGQTADRRKSAGVLSFGGYSVTGGRLTAEADTGGRPLLRQPNTLPSAYYWRTDDSAGYTQFPPQGYVYDAAQTYVDIRTSLPFAGEASGTGDDVPKTGDSAQPMLWLLISLLAGAGLAGNAVRRRKQQNG